MAAVKVDPLELARIVNRWQPVAVDVELTSADRAQLRESVAWALLDELGLDDVDLRESFVSVATSDVYAERVDVDADQADEVTS